MGTIIRTCEWFGINHVYCTDDCVGLYNPKTVQSTMGSIFRVNVYYAKTEEILSLLKSKNYRIIGSDMSGTSLYDFSFKKNSDAFIIGSESHGIRTEMRNGIDEFITIPGEGKAESLNASVAASIILSEVYRRKKIK